MKRGQILVSNIVYILLNLMFLTILVLFILKQGQGAIILEQSYAKQIALVIDSAKPGMDIRLNMEDAKKLSEKNGIDFEDVVEINENIVTIKLSEKGGYEYSFFNDVEAIPYPDGEEDIYFIRIKEK